MIAAAHALCFLCGIGRLRERAGRLGDWVPAVNWVEIPQMLPHRHPFLLIGRLERVDAITSAVAVKYLSSNEPCCGAISPVTRSCPACCR